VNVTDPTETTCPGRPFAHKIRTLAIGALATAALSIPVASSVSMVAGHDAAKAPQKSQPVSNDSHRLALSITPHSVRLT
jgi:hypothetical protein